MKEIKEKAIQKINQEINSYREQQKAKTAEEVYNRSTQNVFVEATAHYSLDLISKSDNITELILAEESNTIDCARAVMSVARKVGSLGAMTLDHFYNAIWDYYKLDHKHIKELEKAEALKREEARKKRERAAQSRVKKQNVTTKSQDNSLAQLSLF